MTRSETEAPAVSHAAGTDVASWFTPGRFAAVLGVLISLTFLEVVTGQQTFFYRDFGVFTYPVAQYHRECFWRGEMPLWNPLNNCGIPLLAQWNVAMLYPPSLFYLVLPLSWSLGVFGLGHLFIAGMGMYFLARRWTGNSLAGAVAGVAFAYNGLSWHSLVWVSNLAAWAWMPWVVLTVEQAWREGGRRIVVAALVGALQMLTGSPEIITLTWFVLAALWAMELLVQGPKSKVQNHRKLSNDPRPTSEGHWTLDFGLWTHFSRPLSVIALITGLAAAQLLPFLDLLRHSSRAAGVNDTGWAMPITGLANFLVPLFHCFEAGHGVFVQIEQYWTPSYYIGIGIVALALVAIRRVRERRVWLLAGLAAFSILMALGDDGHFYAAVKSVVPQLGFMRYPIKFVVLALFALPILAAYGVKWQLGAKDEKSLSGVAFMLLGLVGLILWQAWLHQLPQDNWQKTLQNGVTRAVLLILILGVLAALRRAARLEMQRLMGLALLALLWADVFTHAPKINPTVNRSVYETDLMRKHLNLDPTPQIGEPRARPTLAAIEQVRYTNLEDPTKDYLCRRLALYDNCNLLDGIPKTDGFFSLYLAEADEAFSLLYAGDEQGAELKGFKDFLVVARFIAPAGTNSGDLDWTDRPSHLPLVMAGQKPVFASAAITLKGLGQKAFDPQEIVYLPEAAATFITATNRARAAIHPRQYAAQRLDFDVETDAPAMVTVAQTFYHNWHAYVDGQSTVLCEANFAFQALEVPAGRHEVRLVYEDASFHNGVLISAASLLGCGLIWLRGRRFQEG